MEINYIDADTNVCFYDVDTRLADDRNDCDSSLDSCTVWNYVWDSQIFWDPQFVTKFKMKVRWRETIQSRKPS